MNPLNTLENTVEQTNYEVETVLEKKSSTNTSKEQKSTFFIVAGIVLASIMMFALLAGPKSNTPKESEIKLEALNKVLVYDTILLEDNNLANLQNSIYKDLKKEKQTINYLIANQDLLVMDFNTKELSGHNLQIGTDASIDVSSDKDKKTINYNNFSESGRDIIMKQIDKNNYPKINMKTIESKNKDDTYNINLVIDSH